MSFAKAEIEVIQELSGFKLSLFLAVRHEEFLDGICCLSPAELSRKYKQLSNESNTGRTRKQMIKDGWFIEVDGGIITKTFNTTAKIAVNNNNELQKLQYNEQNTAKIAVNSVDETAKIAVTDTDELQKLQSNTAKIAGTEIALKDLEFKEFKLSLSLSDADVRPPLREIPANELFGTTSDEPMPEEFSPTKAIAIFREIYPTYQLGGEQLTDFANRLPEVEESIWRQNLLDWKLSSWQANNISGIINRYKSELKNWEKEKEREETKNGSIPTNSYKNGKRKQLDRSGGKSDSEKVRTRLRARKPTEV